ncbi:hypothetical protein AMTR_s00005p00242050 [Amborella trichopoda]|uniref:Uncharacterized protein n=1 Tax=Amborella trichopoda TaxID=13333 RepID=W1PFX9_AMBTC|nr:hypothetical protein AMTR_s00005p00242050 [Amborella trichopoda]
MKVMPSTSLQVLLMVRVAGSDASFHILGLASSSDEGVPKTEVHEVALEAGLIKDAKSREIARLQDLVTRLRHELEHHQNMFDF